MRETIDKFFGLNKIEAGSYSPLDLAYIGDCAYELVIRTLLLNQGNAPVNVLNKRASNLAKAGTQSAMINAIMDKLSEEEISIYKRGRNAKSYTAAKNATLSDYKRATGFEALIGWLYLSNNYDRMMEIIKLGFEALDADVLKKG